MANEISLEELKEQYIFVCNEYVSKFCEKQDVDLDFWVSNEVGSVACFNSDFFFGMDEIRFDMDTNQPVGLIFKWQNDSIDAHFRNEDTINYYSYAKGLRYEDINKQ